MENSMSKFLLLIFSQFLLIPQTYANSETLINDYFKGLEKVVQLEDYEQRQSALIEYYKKHLGNEFHRIVMLDYHFRSCHKSIEDEIYSKSISQNHEEFISDLSQEGVKMDLFHFSHEITQMNIDENNKDITISYKLNLGGEVWRKPGKYGDDMDYSPIIDIRECDATFSYNNNALKMKNEECKVSIKEGNLEPWPSKKLLESKCEKSEIVMYQDGRPYEEWQSMREKDRPKAENGDSGAQLFMGYYYLKGFGVKQDYNEALKWFKKASDQGYMYGHSSMGKMYAEGYGVERNLDKAISYYQKACDAGYEGACAEIKTLNPN